MPQILRDAKTIREFWGKNGVLGCWHKIPRFLLTGKLLGIRKEDMSQEEILAATDIYIYIYIYDTCNLASLR
jgi:hypothetical protein